MFKKIASLILAAAMTATMCASLTSCDGTDNGGEDKLKMGFILVGDETEGYTAAHIDGIKKAAKELGIEDSQLEWKYKVEEGGSSYDAASDLVGSGCTYVFSNSYGHQTYMAQAAEAYQDVTFIAATGDFAAISGIPNLKNAFTKIYESRYVSGVVAGLKLKELTESGKLTKETQADSFDENGNVKVGYVGAFNYPEIVSGYTAFFLGIRSVFPTAVMEVNYTNDWFNIDKEAAAAEALMANGCVIIGQHADSTGAPAAVQKVYDTGKIVYSVGYNIDMLGTAPQAALTSATNNWGAYYTYAFKAILNNEDIKADWAEGYSEDAVAITVLGPDCAEGTAEYVADVEAKLKSGELKVFDVTTFTVDGKSVDSYKKDLSYYDFSTGTPVCVYQGQEVETIVDGAFSESSFRSAPYFDLRIDGITEK